MPLEIGCMAYAGFVNLALGKSKYRATIKDRWPPATRRLAGAVLLVMSFAAVIWRLGASQGPVVWLGMLSLAGISLVLLLSRWPALALRLWLPLGLLATVLLAF